MTLAQLHYALAAPQDDRRLPNAPHGKRFSGLAALHVGKAG